MGLTAVSFLYTVILILFRGVDTLFTPSKFQLLTGTAAIIAIYTFCKNDGAGLIKAIGGYHYLVGGLIGCSITTLLSIIYIKYVRPAPFCRTDYKILKADYVYIFDNNDYRKQQLTANITIKALKDGVSKYHARYAWSGKGTTFDPKLSSPMQTIENVQIRSPWTTYEIHFKELTKGEEIDLQIEFEFYDAEDSFSPVFYRNISEEIDNLTLRVIFSKKRLPKANRVKKEIVDILAPNPHTDLRGILSLDKFTNEVIWNEPKPKLNKLYKLSWEWLDTETTKE